MSNYLNISNLCLFFIVYYEFFGLNVLGLALGIGCAVVLFKIISFETSFDSFHKNSDRIVRIVSHFNFAGSNQKSPNVQSQEQYREKTTMIITTDHGRGTSPKDTWRHHGNKVSNAGQIWIAIIGPDSPALGEIKTEA